MITLPSPSVLILGTAALSWVATYGVLALLTRKGIMDHPGERSSHTMPTPRGGGIAVTGIILIIWCLLAWNGGELPTTLVPVTMALGLAILSWFDDLIDLPALLRLAGHFIAAAVVVKLLPNTGMVFQGMLPALVDQGLSVLMLVWFINLFNFMDGIDGISGVETVTIGLGLGYMTIMHGMNIETSVYHFTIAGAAIGFLVLNWHPAKIFLGDVGSVPLGLLLGWLLLLTAVQGFWAAALILPLYYIADATITLIKRALRGEKVWEAHKEHFYQQAHQAGLSHSQVMRYIMVANFCLAALAILSFQREWLCLGLAVVVVAVLLLALKFAPTAKKTS